MHLKVQHHKSIHRSSFWDVEIGEFANFDNNEFEVLTMKYSLFKLYLVLLFPGFFFYHIAHSLGMLPYLGWFGGVLLLGVVFMSFVSAWELLTGKRRVGLSSAPIAVPAALFFIYCIAVVILFHLLSGEKYITTEGLVWNGVNLLQLIGFYLIGKRLSLSSDKSLIVILVVVYGLFAQGALYFYSPQNHTMILPSENDLDGEASASYQSMAMCVLYTMLALGLFISSRALKTTAMLLSVVILYFVGSRTEFFLLAAVVPVFLWINYNKSVLVVLALVFSPVLLYVIGNMEFNERFASTISELGSGSSRYDLLYVGMQGIVENPILGDYLGQVRDSGTTGAYIHNALSVYQQFGLLAFVLYMWLTVCSLMVGLFNIKYARRIPEVEVLIYTSLISLVGILVSKSIGWPLPALAWGVACSVLIMRKRPELTTEPIVSAVSIPVGHVKLGGVDDRQVR